MLWIWPGLRAADEQGGPQRELGAISDLQERMRCWRVVHYTFGDNVSHCSIHTRVIQPSKGNTAAARFAYQTCSTADDRFGHVDYRCYAPYRVGGCVLLPMGAPAELAEWENFSKAVISRETRRNAQEGRVLDFALPRGVARELLLPLAAFALLPFVELGMAVRLDIECVDASDGEPNPHAHAWLSQRELKQGGFGLKVRPWNTLFRRDGCRHIRALVAARLTLGCAILGVEAYVDPRRNDVRGAGAPELRLTRVLWSMYSEGRHVEAIEQLKASRQPKGDRMAAKHAPGPVVASVRITNAAVYYRDDDEEAAELLRRFADAAQEAGYELELASGSPALALSGTAVAFDGRAFTIADIGSSEDAAIVARFARRLEWPGLVVEGGARLADLIAIAGAAEGVFMINRAPSAEARDRIARAYYSEMKDDIAHHDPLGIAAGFFANSEANKVAAQPAEVLDAALQVNVGCDPQSPANLVVPNTAPAGWSNVAEPASVVAPIATSDSEKRVAAGWDDVRRTAAFSSKAIARTSGDRSEARRPPRVGVTSNPPRSPADLRAPSTAPLRPNEVAGLASAVAPMATSGNDSPRGAAGADARRTAGSSSQPFEGLEMLPQDDSWEVAPDPSRSARDALALEVGFRRQRQTHEELDEFLRRKTRQSSGLRREGAVSPGNAKLQQPTRRPQPIPQWPAEIPAVGQAVETEEPDYQAPRP